MLPSRRRERSHLKIAVLGSEVINAELKQPTLLFDRIAIPQLNYILDGLASGAKKHNSLAIAVLNDLEFLMDKDIVFDPGPSEELMRLSDKELGKAVRRGSGQAIFDVLALNSIVEEVLLKKSARQKNSALRTNSKSVLFYQSLARISALKLQLIDGVSAAPVYFEPAVNVVGSNDGAANVFELILRHVPIPDELTPWEVILDFKKDPDVQGHFMGLLNWINDTTRQTLPANQVQEKLEWLLFQQRKHLEIHKVKYRLGVLGSTVIASAEVAENIAKLKFSEALKAILKISDKKVELLETELKGPGKELNYLLRAQRAFSK